MPEEKRNGWMSTEKGSHSHSCTCVSFPIPQLRISQQPKAHICFLHPLLAARFLFISDLTPAKLFCSLSHHISPWLPSPLIPFARLSASFSILLRPLTPVWQRPQKEVLTAHFPPSLTNTHCHTVCSHFSQHTLCFSPGLTSTQCQFNQHTVFSQFYRHTVPVKPTHSAS